MRGTSLGDNKPKNCPVSWGVGSLSAVHGSHEGKSLLAPRQEENPTDHPALMEQTVKPRSFSGVRWLHFH